MKVLVDLNDGMVGEILRVADKEEVAFNTMISMLVEISLRQLSATEEAEVRIKKNDVKVIEELLNRVTQLEKETVFIVKELLTDYWSEIYSPISFGRKAAKALLESGLVEEVSTYTASRKYKRI